MMLRKFLSRTLTAAVLATLCGAFGNAAWALSLGRAAVQSSLGQALSAEIEVNIASDAEAETLSVDLASAQTYAAANLEYSPALKGVKVLLQSRSVGTTAIQIVGQLPLNEPVLQLLLEVRWSTGKMVRAFTLFIDPAPAGDPNLPSANTTVSAVPSTAIVAEKIPALPPTEAPAEHRADSETPKAGAVANQAKTPPGSEAPRRSAMVRKGQTMRQIAAGIHAKDATIEQVMLALLRANPDAFAAANINRLKAGAELSLEPLPDVQALSASEAAKEVARQAAAFAAWQKGTGQADGKGSGEKVAESKEGRSTNKKVGTASSASKPKPGKDELKLGAAKESDKADAEKLAAEMQAKEDAERKAELAKNIEALKETAAKTSATVGSGTAESSAPEKERAKEPAATPTLTAKIAEQPAPAQALSPWDAAKQALVSLDPTIWAAAGGVLLVVLLFFLRKQAAEPRAKDGDADTPQDGLLNETAHADAAALTPGDAVSPDAFSNPPTRWEDTTLNQAAPQSVLFADSQLKPSDSLDAVAEADVYLAYGRDVQAEEILREALGVTPNKVELHQKLLDIFVLRGDRDAFAQVAQTMSTYLDSQGPEWLRVCELGALLDGKNPLYHNHASPGSLGADPAAAATVGAFPSPMEFPAGLDLNLSKPVTLSASTVAPPSQDFRPSTQVQPLGFEFSSQNLVLAPDGKTPLEQPWTTETVDESARLLEQKIELAKEFISVGDTAGARILLNEVIERAQGAQLEQAKQLLAQIG